MTDHLTRRSVLKGLGSTALLGPGSPLHAKSAARTSLAAAAQKAGLLFGASIAGEVFDDPSYAALYKRHCKIVTTDVALKFDYLRWREGEWHFEGADRLLAFCERHDLLLRGHTLIWNENPPPWLKKHSGREITRLFDEHIDRVMGRYYGRLHSWDVVNEPFWPGHGKKGGYRTGPWFEAMGPAYVARAFKRAALADPHARLVLNEAHCERDDEVGRMIRKHMLRLVDELLDQGVMLDGIGLQGHLQPAKAYSDKAFTDFLWQLHARGLNIYISELDVNDAPYPRDPQKRDRLVAKRYRDFLGAVLKVPSVKAVICWQLADRYSWLRSLALQDNPKLKQRPAQLPRPLPFDAQLQPKPAYDALLKAFSRRR